MESQRDSIRVLIADDEEDIRSLLAEIIQLEPSLELAGVAIDADEAIRLADEVAADVAILDWMMPGGGGARAARVISDSHPSTRVIALTALDANMASYDMMTAGAVGFLRKGCSRSEIVDSIRSVVRW